MNIQIEDQVLTIPLEITNLSHLLSLLHSQSPDEIIVLSPQIITKQIWFIIYSFFLNHNFKPPIQYKIESSNLLKELNENDFNLIKDVPYQSQFYKELIFAANYLQIETFKKFLIARIAIEYYIDPNNEIESINKISQRYPDIPLITSVDYKQYFEEAPYLEYK